MVLNYVDEYVKRHTPSKFTDLTVKRAEKMLFEACAAKEAKLEARAKSFKRIGQRQKPATAVCRVYRRSRNYCTV